MKTQQKYQMQWIIFFVFLGLFILIVLATLYVWIFKDNLDPETQKAIPIFLFIEVGGASIALFYFLFGIKQPSEIQSKPLPELISPPPEDKNFIMNFPNEIDNIINDPSNYDPKDSKKGELIRLQQQARISESKDLLLFNEVRKNLNLSNPSILDVGCGDGFYSMSRFVNEKKWGFIYGIDHDQILINSACSESEDQNRYKFVCNDIIKGAKNKEDLKFLFKADSELGEIKFNIIILINTLHHLGKDNQSKVLKYLWNHLEPGGAMIIKTCDDSLRLIYPNPNNDSETLLKLSEIKGASDRYNGRRLYSLLNSLPNITSKDIKIDYFLYDTTHMDKNQCLDFFAYDNSFRIDTLARAINNSDDIEIVEKLNQANDIYKNFTNIIEESFRGNEVFYALAAEVVGIAYKNTQ
jgi:2-polyprenyl-3-methyl-5-hydroxy-6-metoxy-1,4-benzoquinol methylase